MLYAKNSDVAPYYPMALAVIIIMLGKNVLTCSFFFFRSFFDLAAAGFSSSSAFISASDPASLKASTNF